MIDGLFLFIDHVCAAHLVTCQTSLRQLPQLNIRH